MIFKSSFKLKSAIEYYVAYRCTRWIQLHYYDMSPLLIRNWIKRWCDIDITIKKQNSYYYDFHTGPDRQVAKWINTWSPSGFEYSTRNFMKIQSQLSVTDGFYRMTGRDTIGMSWYKTKVDIKWDYVPIQTKYWKSKIIKLFLKCGKYRNTHSLFFDNVGSSEHLHRNKWCRRW